MAPVKVLLIGATGETGRSIANGLLEAGGFVCSDTRSFLLSYHPWKYSNSAKQEVYAFTRAASVAKPQLIELEKKGVIIRQCDLTAPEDELVEALKGMDIVVSSVGPSDQHIQINLATAAKAAGVKRFIPCGFITVCAPGGIMWLRDEVSPPFFSLEG